MRSRRGPSTRRRFLRPLPLAGALFLLVVLLGLLALPFRSAPDAAEAAKADLEAAKAALTAGDIDAAQTHVDDARGHADDLQGAVQGIGGDVWSLIPVVGGPVRDVRHLGNALDDLTRATEQGVALLPQVRGDSSTLLEDGNVDLDLLAEVTDQVDTISGLVDRAQSELYSVADQRMLIGSRLGDARDEAADQVKPLADGLATAEPILDELPLLLGANADRQYLVALLNPAELRYSGGTPLTFTTMNFDKGRLTIDDPVDTTTARGTGQDIYWKKVKGNRFHRGRLKVLTSTMAPDWSVSGNELANAWRSLRGRRLAGVAIIDVPALADLIALTGPIELPTLGKLTSDTLVEKLIGSYDQYPDPEARKATNRALAPIFSERLLSGDPLETGKVLARAADERRFAVFLRSPQEQAVFDDLGLTGRLGAGDHDYIGVFTQSRVPSKSDYWQRRVVRSDVDVREDGSAHVRLAVDIHNDSPPYLREGVDPRFGYFTRWAGISVLTMLPEGAEFTGGSVDGKSITVHRSNFYGRTFQRQSINFAPQARHELVVEYDVPSVAALDASGAMTYQLAIDPQGTVNPQGVDVRVRFPEGFLVDSLPPGWQGDGTRSATFRTDAFETSEVFKIGARP